MHIPVYFINSQVLRLLHSARKINSFSIKFGKNAIDLQHKLQYNEVITAMAL